MIISPGRGYIFVHIPKTGGTSLARALEARAHRDDILVGDTPKARQRKARLKRLTPRGRLWKHSTLADIDGILTPGEIAAMRRVALVRNPWDRMVSYYHWLRVQDFAHPAVRLSQQLEFAAFLAHPQTLASLRAWPAARYLRDASGADRGDIWVRLEHLSEDLAPFEAHLGFRLTPERDNDSERCADYRGYYSDASAGLVAEACAEDIARFGYSFG